MPQKNCRLRCHFCFPRRISSMSKNLLFLHGPGSLKLISMISEHQRDYRKCPQELLGVFGCNTFETTIFKPQLHHSLRYSFYKIRYFPSIKYLANDLQLENYPTIQDVDKFCSHTIVVKYTKTSFYPQV